MLSDYQTLVTDLVRDDAGKVSTLQRDAAIAAAVEQFSMHRPRTTVEDVTAIAGHQQSLPSAWEDDFSHVVSLEHPVGQVPPVYIDAENWTLYQDTAGWKLMLRYGLTAGSTLRVCLTIRHVLSSGVDTIPLQHREAVSKLAAASLCEQLAAFYANESDSTIGADRTQGQSKSQAYAARARDYRKQYQDIVGTQDKTATPSGAVVQLNPRNSLGQPRLFHPPGSSRP